MIRWIKQFFCEHDWYELSVRREVTYTCPHTSENEHSLIAHICCPKCKKRKRMSANEWELLDKQQQIIKEYKFEYNRQFIERRE